MSERMVAEDKMLANQFFGQPVKIVSPIDGPGLLIENYQTGATVCQEPEFCTITGNEFNIRIEQPTDDRIYNVNLDKVCLDLLGKGSSFNCRDALTSLNPNPKAYTGVMGNTVDSEGHTYGGFEITVNTHPCPKGIGYYEPNICFNLTDTNGHISQDIPVYSLVEAIHNSLIVDVKPKIDSDATIVVLGIAACLLVISGFVVTVKNTLRKIFEKKNQ